MHVLVLAFLMVVLSTVPASAQRSYRVVDIGTLGGTYAAAWGINAQGRIVGEALTETFTKEDAEYNRAVYWEDGWITEIGTLGGNHARAFAVNAGGAIAGDSFTRFDAATHAFRYSDYDGMIDLGTLSGHTTSLGRGINDQGWVVGWSGSPGLRAFLWRGGGSMIQLPTDGPESAATAINNAGHVVGWTDTVSGPRYACLWTSPEASPTLLGFVGTPWAINGDGHVVAEVGPWTDPRPFHWIDGQFTALPLPAGVSRGTARAVNARGQIVGDGFGSGALLWEFGRVYRLEDLIPAGSGWQLYRANAINDQGHIVGVGNFRGGFSRAFLLIPQ